MRVADARDDPAPAFDSTLVGFAGIARAVKRFDAAAHQHANAGARHRTASRDGELHSIVRSANKRAAAVLDAVWFENRAGDARRSFANVRLCARNLQRCQAPACAQGEPSARAKRQKRRTCQRDPAAKHDACAQRQSARLGGKRLRGGRTQSGRGSQQQKRGTFRHVSQLRRDGKN